MASFIPLSPVDHVFTGVGAYPIQFIFTFAGRLDAAVLEASLVDTLDAFPALRSRLEQVDDFSYGLVPHEPGYTFQAEEGPIENAKLDRVATLPGEDLLKIRLFNDRNCSALAVSSSHCITDGYSYFYFLTCWAAAFQNKAFSAPLHDRRLLVPKDLPKEKITPESLKEASSLFWAGRRRDIPESKLKRSTLRFPAAALKSAVQQSNQETDVALSENDVLCALLCKKLSEGKTGSFTVVSPVDYRRLHPRLTPFYFGNAVCNSRTEMTAEWIASHPVTEIAVAIRRANRRIKGNEAETALRYIEAYRRQEGLKAMENLELLDPRGGVLITNMSRLPLKALDFGAGSPVSARIETPAHGLVAILAHADGVEVNISMEEK